LLILALVHTENTWAVDEDDPVDDRDTNIELRMLRNIILIEMQYRLDHDMVGLPTEL
jgi:hypothetical protein